MDIYTGIGGGGGGGNDVINIHVVSITLMNSACIIISAPSEKNDRGHIVLECRDEQSSLNPHEGLFVYLQLSQGGCFKL